MASEGKAVRRGLGRASLLEVVVGETGLAVVLACALFDEPDGGSDAVAPVSC